LVALVVMLSYFYPLSFLYKVMETTLIDTKIMFDWVT
jgi:hypothetical protein